MAKQDIKDFNARVRRIKNPRNKSYYDPDLGMHVPKRVSRKQIRKSNEEPSPLTTMLVSMVLGAFGYTVAQIIRVRYFGLIEPSTTVYVIEAVATIWAVILITALTNKRTFFERTAQVLGVLAMLAAGHNMIWRWPDQMSTLYSAAYVDHVMETTEERSVIVRGSIYSF